MRTKPNPEAAAYGIDIGKKVFHVVAMDKAGRPIQRAKFARETLLRFFEAAEPALIGMEACAGSQWLARKLIAIGHDARIIPAKFVKAYVRSNKSDTIDAEDPGPESPQLVQSHRIRVARSGLEADIRGADHSFSIGPL